jgi:hypothetical protein
MCFFERELDGSWCFVHLISDFYMQEEEIWTKESDFEELGFAGASCEWWKVFVEHYEEVLLLEMSFDFLTPQTDQNTKGGALGFSALCVSKKRPFTDVYTHVAPGRNLGPSLHC